MTDPKFEAFLARVFVNAAFRAEFLRNPQAEALRAGLSQEQAEALAKIDRQGLDLASRSFEKKRSKRGMPGGH